MREWLRSTTVSQRSTVSRRRDRCSSRRVVEPVSHGGLAGDCNRVKNILPDLNSEANPSESEGGYAGDDSEFNVSLAENDVLGLAADEGIKSKGVDAEVEGEVGKDLVHSCLIEEEQCELEVDGESRNSGAMMIDLNVEVIESDSLAFSNLCANEEGVVLEEDVIMAVDGVMQPDMALNDRCGVDIAACSEHDVLSETKVKISETRPSGFVSCSENIMCIADSPGVRLDMIGDKRNVPEEEKPEVRGKVLRSRVVGVIGDGRATRCSKRKRATGCQVKATEELMNVERNENLEGQKKKHKGIRGRPREKDKESLLLNPVLQGKEACAEELEDDENSKCFDGQNKSDNECWKSSNEKDENTGPLDNGIEKDGAAAEVLNNENLEGRNKKHKGVCGKPREKDKESILLNHVLQGEEACAEELKNDENSECFDGQNNSDNECWKRSNDKDENTCPLESIIKKDGAAAEVLNDENLEGQNKKHRVLRGRPREKDKESILLKPRGEEACAEELKNDENNECFDGQNKTDNECWKRSNGKDENSGSLNNIIEKDGAAAEVLNNENLEGRNKKHKKCKTGRGRGRPRKQHKVSSEDMLKIKQEESSQLTDGTDKPLKKRRGRPRKIHQENDENKLILHDGERTGKGGRGKGGAGMKKQDSHQSVECKKNPCGKGQENSSLSTMFQNDEAASEGEAKIKIEESNESPHATNKLMKLQHGGLKKRGRPRKIIKENDAQESISQDEEGIEKALVVTSKEDTHRSIEGSVRRVKRQIVEGTQIEVKTSTSGTASPSSSSRLKRKRLPSDSVVKAKSSTREEKQKVRLQIVDMLTNAGWTVEYKPRQGKEYADAVYRCPAGKTHWSVTLAYRVLKKQVDMGIATNFSFTPIPEETLSTLFRHQVNTRSDKNKPRPKSSVKLSGKRNGRKKREYSSGEEEKTADSHFKRKPSSARSGKQNRRRCALLVRGSGHGSNFAAEEFTAVSGKNSVLSWMIKSGVIPPGEKVHCRRRTRVLLEGSITRDGIHCSCCSKLHSVAQFEAHAGNRSCPMYENLYLDNGSSLLQCQLESWNKQEESIHLGFHKVNIDDNDPNDDTCGICGDGGNLICCDGCPSTFHQACLNIEKFPSGDWHCVYCSCKYCGTVGGGVDEDKEKEDKSPSLLTCGLCDGKYHQLCADEKEYGQSSASAFCGKICEQIYEGFQRLVGVSAEVGDGYTCTLIKRPDSSARPDVLEPKEIENMSKLAVALSVMEECFLPIIDHRSGVNLMRHTLYSCGSNFKRLDFKGFFTAILEKEDEIICAASIRIHGKELAEMPFIGTRNAYRRQGMCRRLLAGIETALRTLAIEKLVIPAVSEVTETWTSVFGFEPLGELGTEMRHMNIIVFPGVDMLQKPLFAGETTSEPEHKHIEPVDSWSKKQAEENGLMETKVQNGCLGSEYSDPAIEALQDAELSSANGSHFPLEYAAVGGDQEEGSKSELVSSDTVHSSEENKPSTVAKDDKWPGEASDLAALSSQDPVLEACELVSSDTVHISEENKPSTVAKDDGWPGEASDQAASSPQDPVLEACEDIQELSNPLTTSGGTVFEDHVSRSAENGPDDTAPEGCDNTVNNADPCNDHRPADITIQPNRSIDCPSPKLEVEPSELVNMSVMDHSVANDAQVIAQTPELLESDLQIDCEIVTQFNLEKACNIGSGSNDLSTPFHAVKL